jgi:RNA polymerase sigma-70 factor (ECF subfamily)
MCGATVERKLYMLILSIKADKKQSKAPSKAKSGKAKAAKKSSQPTPVTAAAAEQAKQAHLSLPDSALPVVHPADTLTQEEIADFNAVEALMDEDLMQSEAATRAKEPEKLTRAEIEKQRDFQREAMVHIDSLYNFALRMTGDPEDANDLVQETYMKAYRFFDSFEKGTNCKAWLFRILKNSYINKYRKESKEPDKVDYDEIKEFYHSVKHSSLDSNDMQEKMFAELLDDEVAQALESLPEDFKEVVQLCDIEGFTYEEIANMVDCPIGTVRSRLHRGRKILREKLMEYARQHGYKVNHDDGVDE